jgi:DNA (cytosine-5)-methyltransferase 1
MLEMRSIELFAGAGGLGIGLSKAGFKPIKVVEWDKWCCDTIRQNRAQELSCISDWPEPVQSDVRLLDFTSLEGSIALVSGGPPCQPFSMGGKHKAHDDHRDMWPEAVRVVRETKPEAFIFENVKGLKRSTFSTYLAYIVHQLSYPEIVRRHDESWLDHLARLERNVTSSSSIGLQYKVVYRLINAANYGIPQRRERLVFVGFRKDLGTEWAFPEETHSLDALLWEQAKSHSYWERHGVVRSDRTIDNRLIARGAAIVEKPNKLPWLTVRDATSDLPDPESTEASSRFFMDHRFQPGARSYTGHTGSPLDEPAKTLKAGVHGVPGGENMLRKPDGCVRYFTVRESARLQTFPDSYRFHGSWTETMRQLGNAVPVKLAEVIASNVSKHLSKGD